MTQLPDARTRPLRSCATALRRLRHFTMVLIVAIVALSSSSCKLLNQSLEIADALRVALGGRNSNVTVKHSDDSLTIIRTYPVGYIDIDVAKDSLFTLPSGDQVLLVWRSPAKAKAIVVLLPDTIRLPKP